MKISSKVHGVIDYLFVAFMAAAPTLFDLPETASNLAYMIAALHLVVTALTDFELGVVRVIPFRVHGLLEVVMALVFGVIAFYLKDKEGELACNFYLAIAVWTLFAWVITDFKKVGSRVSSEVH